MLVTLDLGVVVIDPTRASEESFFTGGKLSVSDGAIDVNLSDFKLVTVNIAIKNIPSDKNNMDIIIAAYVTLTNGDTATTTFIQHGATNVAKTYEKLDAVLYSMSYDTALRETEEE